MSFTLRRPPRTVRSRDRLIYPGIRKSVNSTYQRLANGARNLRVIFHYRATTKQAEVTFGVVESLNGLGSPGTASLSFPASTCVSGRQIWARTRYRGNGYREGLEIFHSGFVIIKGVAGSWPQRR